MIMDELYGLSCRPTVKINDDGHMSTYKKLCYVLEKIQEVIDVTNGFGAELDLKEDSSNITGARKLDENGNFIGTWIGESKDSLDMKIVEGLNNYNTIYDYLKANPQIGWVYWDGCFIGSIKPIGLELDGGLITDLDVDEVDCGCLVYPCNCEL